VNGPRPALTGANRVPIRNNDNSQQMKQPQQSFGRARVNHIDAQEAQGAQGVVLGEYLVNSALATVLFDSEHRTRSYPQVLWKNTKYLQYY
jgi:hypothetical protein